MLGGWLCALTCLSVHADMLICLQAIITGLRDSVADFTGASCDRVLVPQGL
jgi:hypothetical protein